MGDFSITDGDLSQRILLHSLVAASLGSMLSRRPPRFFIATVVQFAMVDAAKGTASSSR